MADLYRQAHAAFTADRGFGAEFPPGARVKAGHQGVGVELHERQVKREMTMNRVSVAWGLCATSGRRLTLL